MRDFVVSGPTSRVVFARGCVAGTGAAAPALEEIRALGCRHLVLIGSPRALAAVGGLRAQLETAGLAVVGVVDDLEGQHVPEELVQRVGADVERWDADALVSVSGGTSIGVAKAVAVAAVAASPTNGRRLVVVCIPTTYSGSEVTAYYGVKEADPTDTGGGGSRKVSKRDEAARPQLVLYDPALLQSLPTGLAVASLFNALAHAFEVLWLPRAAPQSTWAAREAVRVLLGALPTLTSTQQDQDQQPPSPPETIVDELLFGAYLAAYALDAESLGLQHRLAHVLGGAYGLPHAEAHAAILPYVVHFHAQALPTELLDALGTADVAGRVYDVQHATVRYWVGLVSDGVGLLHLRLEKGWCVIDQPPDQPTTPHVRTYTQTAEPPSLARLGFLDSNVAEAIDKLLAVGGITEHPLAPLERGRLEAMLRLAVSGERPPFAASSSTAVPCCYPTPRIPLLDDAAFRAQDPEAAERIFARRKGRLLNLDRALMHAPAVAQAWNGMFGCLRSGLALDGRLRELVILRVAVLNRAYYEWYQHYDVFVAEGGTAEEAAALGDPGASALLSARDQAVLAYVDAMTRRVQVPDAVAAAAREAVGGAVKELVEVTALCGGYNLVSRFLEALHLTPEQTARLPPMPRDRQGV